MEQIEFENDNSIVLKYGKNKLTCKTKLSELAEIFGNEIIKHFENKLNGEIIIFREEADDGIRIKIKDGKLIGFEYWSPC